MSGAAGNSNSYLEGISLENGAAWRPLTGEYLNNLQIQPKRERVLHLTELQTVNRPLFFPLSLVLPRPYIAVVLGAGVQKKTSVERACTSYSWYPNKARSQNSVERREEASVEIRN